MCRKEIRLTGAKHSCRFTSGASLRRVAGKFSKVIAFTERRERESREPFPTSKIFDLEWPFHHRCRSEEERTFLISRVRRYAFGRRRGGFKLPSRFRDLVDEVSGYSKAEVRQMIFQVKPEISLECRLLQSTFEFANRVLTRCVWRFSGSISEDCARRVDVHRLAKKDWPRNARSLWPSTPSVSELIGMSRAGKVPVPLQKPRKLVLDPPTMRDLSTNSRLATRVVADNVIGIRSSVFVPRMYHPWFKYRDGFLILVVRYSMPIGLVRFLLGAWKTNPFNLWLNVNCRLKHYLRLTPNSPVKDRKAQDVESAGIRRDLILGTVEATLNSSIVVATTTLLEAPSIESAIHGFRRTQLAKLTK